MDIVWCFSNDHEWSIWYCFCSCSTNNNISIFFQEKWKSLQVIQLLLSSFLYEVFKLKYLDNTEDTPEVERIVKRKIKMHISIEKERLFHCFSRWIFSAWVKFNFFVLHGGSILIHRKQWHKICFDKVLHCLRCGLCDTNMLLFLWWLSQ